MGIVSYRWGDAEFNSVIGFTTDPNVTYTIPAVVGNKEYDAFVGLGTTTAYPYIEPEVVIPPNYMGFWVGLVTSTYYAKVKSAASTGLQTNTSATEFIALFGDAKAGARIEPLLQASFDELLTLVPTDAADEAFLDSLLVNTGLDDTYTLTYVGVGSTGPTGVGSTGATGSTGIGST